MNFQNIPQGLDDVKRAFVPKQGAFSFFDYQKIEPRLLAYFLAVAPNIHDTSLADAVKAGKDLYREIVAPMFGKTPAELTEAEYKRGKIQFLSLMYGGGVNTIMEQFGITSRKEAKGIITGFREAWPSIVDLQDSLLATVQSRGFIRTPWGRHLHLEQYGEHKLLNKLIQGSAADLMKASLVKIDRWLAEAHISEGYLPVGAPYGSTSRLVQSHMVSVIHDEIIFDGPESEIELLHIHIPRLMDDERISAVVPIGVDHEVSTTNWAEKSDYEEWIGQRQADAPRGVVRA